ncbi:hypothetical protein ACLMJK_003577 [Lecanora helva]
MTPVVHSSLPTVTVRRIEVEPGQPVRLSDFLRGLKRPNPRKPTSHLSNLGDTTPPGVTRAAHAEGLVRPDMNLAEISGKGNQSNDHVDSDVAKVIALADSSWNRPVSQHGDITGGSTPLFCSQGSDNDNEEIACHAQESVKAQNSMSHDSNADDSITSRKTKAAASRSHSIQKDNEQCYTIALNPDSDGQAKPKKRISVQKDKKAKNRKRRAPLNELICAPSLPAGAGYSAAKEKSQGDATISPDNQILRSETMNQIDSISLGELEEYDRPSDDTQKPSKRANVGKPVSRIRKEVNVPPFDRISHEGFKFPPTTPKQKRSLAWKLGSGFEGITLEHGVPLNRTKARHRSLQSTALVALELSKIMSPSLNTRKTSPRLNVQANTSLPVTHDEISTSPTFDRAREPGGSFVPHMEPPAPTCFQKSQPLLAQKPDQCEQSRLQALRTQTCERPINQLNHSPNAQAFQRPSQSGRNLWLKRRKRVSFAAEDDLGMEHQSRNACPKAELILDDHNAKWYGERDVHDDPFTELQNLDAQKLALNSQHRRLPADHHERCVNSLDNACDSGRQADPRATSIGKQELIVPGLSKSRKDWPSQPTNGPTHDVGSFGSMTRRKPTVRAHPVHLFPELDDIEDSQERGTLSNNTGSNAAITMQGDTMRINQSTSNSRFHRPHKTPQTLSSPNRPPPLRPIRKSMSQAFTFSNPYIDIDEGSPITFHAQQSLNGVNVLSSKGPIRRSRTEHGDLELGVSPRLGRSLSKLQFRPPFKSLA